MSESLELPRKAMSIRSLSAKSVESALPEQVVPEPAKVVALEVACDQSDCQLVVHPSLKDTA